MVFRRRCGSVVCGPWRELQMAGEWTLGVCGAELRRGWWRWLEELVVSRRWWLMIRDVVEWRRWWRDMGVWWIWWGWVGVGLMLPLAQRRLLPLLLLAKDVNVIL
jgi:hypothetical protein